MKKFLGKTNIDETFRLKECLGTERITQQAKIFVQILPFFWPNFGTKLQNIAKNLRNLA